jgi:uncharacterized protein (DUF1499 family)
MNASQPSASSADRPVSRAARGAAALGIACVVLVVAGPAGIRLGTLTPLGGFKLFGLAILVGLGALGEGLVGLVGTRRGMRSGRAGAWLGVAFGGALVALIAVVLFSARGLPAINDITTDPAQPPAFAAARELAPNRGRDMNYPKGFAALQTKAYPDLAPLVIAAPPADVMKRAEAAAKKLGWHVESDDARAGHLEATDTSTLFRFVDDVAVRVRPKPDGGSIVDVRSKSRDGKGDLGVNAKRIRAFLALMKRR